MYGLEIDGEVINISVLDSGAGVPPCHQEKVFDKFVQFDFEGTDTDGRGAGLGLAITRRIAKLHGGDASVRNSPDGGAVFTLTIPFAPADESPVANHAISMPR